MALNSFKEGAKTLGINLTEEQLARFLLLSELLQKWSKVHNLSTRVTPLEIETYHFLDSLSVLPFFPSGNHLDIGCGAGFPGLPLAIMRPNDNFTLLDSNGKKTTFVQRAIFELKLSNCVVVNTRIEDFIDGQKFTSIISRAFAKISKFINLIYHLIGEQSVVLAMKGKLLEHELDELTERVNIASVQELTVPGLSAERHLVIMKRSESFGENIGHH